MNRIKTIKDVVSWGLCVGCGACQYYCGRDKIKLENIPNIGIRPIFSKVQDIEYEKCLEFCPGYSIGKVRDTPLDNKDSANALIGPTTKIWQGHAADEEIRYKASSGGVVSALALYCLEQEKMAFVIHTGMDPERPWINKTFQSNDRLDILNRTGSRYAPSSPCEALDLIEKSSKPCVFIGKPCDVAATMSLRKHRPKLDTNLGLVLTFFCAGPPCTDATLSLLKELKINKWSTNEIRYRGNGWPGHFHVIFNKSISESKIPYKQAWGKLVKHHRSLRCNLCPDGLGELADISCGDAWHLYNPNKEDPGQSIVLARNQRGAEIIQNAINNGYLLLEPTIPAAVIKAQPLTARRTEIYGRIFAMKTLLMPSPIYSGFPLRELWLKNSFSFLLKTYIGTLRRLLTRGLWQKKS